MFDIGWLELILIGIVALIVVGPEDLPGMFRTVGRFMGRARGMAREFQRSMEQAADETGLREATRDFNDLRSAGDFTPKGAAKWFAKKTMTGEDGPKPADPPVPSTDDSPKPAAPAKAGAAALPGAKDAD